MKLDKTQPRCTIPPLFNDVKCWPLRLPSVPNLSIAVACDGAVFFLTFFHEQMKSILSAIQKDKTA